MTIKVDYSELLKHILKEPGIYCPKTPQNFHSYSFGNQMLAIWQCLGREIPFGPIGTFNHWKACGRYVKKGESAIELCMPSKFKVKPKDGEPMPDPKDPDSYRIGFIFRRNWFVLAQTESVDGTEYKPVSFTVQNWDSNLCLEQFKIKMVNFESGSMSTGGYASVQDGQRVIALNPLNSRPESTLIHEIAHHALKHISDDGLLRDENAKSRAIREFEAESTAYLVQYQLGMLTPEQESSSRYYCQTWFAGNELNEKIAHRVINAVGAILKNGFEKPTENPDLAANAQPAKFEDHQLVWC